MLHMTPLFGTLSWTSFTWDMKVIAYPFSVPESYLL